MEAVERNPSRPARHRSTERRQESNAHAGLLKPPPMTRSTSTSRLYGHGVSATAVTGVERPGTKDGSQEITESCKRKTNE